VVAGIVLAVLRHGQVTGSAEITLARRYRIPARLRQHQHLGLTCDLGFTTLDDDPADPTVITGRRASRHHRLSPAEQATNRLVTTLIRTLTILTNAHVTRSTPPATRQPPPTSEDQDATPSPKE
jgi:hypothetical protein